MRGRELEREEREQCERVRMLEKELGGRERVKLSFPEGTVKVDGIQIAARNEAGDLIFGHEEAQKAALKDIEALLLKNHGKYVGKFSSESSRSSS